MLQALFESFGHSNVHVNGRLEQGPVMLNDGDLIEVKQRCFQLILRQHGRSLMAASACHLPLFEQLTSAAFNIT